MSNDMKQLSLVIPVYNSIKILPRTIEQLLTFFNHKEYLTEIIFVDDGSKDGSVALIEKMISIHSSVLTLKIFRHQKNMGKGASIRYGIINASNNSDYVFFTDDDLPFGLVAIEEMVSKFDKNDAIDIIVGDRTLAFQPNPYPLSRKLGSILFSLLLPGRITDKYPDTQCGLKGFKMLVAKKIFFLVKNSRWSFDVEVFLMAIHYKLIIEKFPIVILDHVKASRLHAKDYLLILKEVLYLWLYYLDGYYKNL